MKKIFTLLILTISFSMNAQLGVVNEGGKTGQRLTTSNADNHGDIGNNAVDLSYSNTTAPSGATGTSSVALGENTTASGTYSTAMGFKTKASGTNSIALIESSEAAGYDAFAAGDYALAYGNFAIAMGNSPEASGDYSVAIGSSAVANANSSFSIGNDTTASGMNALALGNYSEAIGVSSIAIGDSSIASGKGSFAIGNQYVTNATTPEYLNKAVGDYSFVFGNNNSTTGSKSFSIGTDNLSSGTSSVALGENNIASGNFSQAIGLFNQSTAYSSFAIGNNTLADGYTTFAIGSANTADSTADADNWSLDNRAFVIGNGTYNTESETLNRSDALTVLFDGTTTIAGDLNINSDMRLKANIISLGSTLSKLLQIDGKTYTMKKDASNKKKIGLLAQDIEKVFPELVSEANDIKSVNYQGLVPVLINALKEQQLEIDRLKAQEKRLEKLEQIIYKMNK